MRLKQLNQLRIREFQILKELKELEIFDEKFLNYSFSVKLERVQKEILKKCKEILRNPKTIKQVLDSYERGEG
tara:strand:+ start:1631 stop:1849 length:219 start_codon:yes stop_codon:yes gene_type:complete